MLVTASYALWHKFCAAVYLAASLGLTLLCLNSEVLTIQPDFGWIKGVALTMPIVSMLMFRARLTAAVWFVTFVIIAVYANIHDGVATASVYNLCWIAALAILNGFFLHVLMAPRAKTAVAEVSAN